MADEDTIQATLQGRFPFLADKVRVQRARRVYVEVPGDRMLEVLDCLFKEMGFGFLSAITGLDLGENFGAIYHLSRADGTMVNLEARVPRGRPDLATVTGYFPVAEAFERELVDLLGFAVRGLPAGFRYPLSEDWPSGQHPLRKDWSPPGDRKPDGEGGS